MNPWLCTVSRPGCDHMAQTMALKGAWCEKVFTEKSSGAKRDRPQLRKALDYLRKGDCLVVWKPDRLARSTLQLAERTTSLTQRSCGSNS